MQITETIRSVDRSVGAMLGGEVARRYGHAGLAEDTIAISLTGTAGQAFGAFLAAGISIDLVGEANDYVGKGLSGGRLVVRPSEKSAARAGRLDRHRQHRALRRRSRASATSTASPANASPCATRAPSRWSRAPATMAANT